MKNRILTGLVLGALMFAAPSTPAHAQVVSSAPVIQLTQPIRITGTIEQDSSGTRYLRTANGDRILLSQNLTYLDPNAFTPIKYVSLAPGTTILTEWPSGESTITAINGDLITLQTTNGSLQVPLGLIPVSAETATVQVRQADGTLVTRPLGDAIHMYSTKEGVIVFPNTGLATFSTPNGLVTINLMPMVNMTEGFTAYGTVQKTEDLHGQRTVHVLTSHGDHLAAPIGFINNGECKWEDCKIGDRVSIDIPDNTSTQLTEIFGDEGQFKLSDGRMLQIPFNVIPERNLRDTTVAVRKMGGEIDNMSLARAVHREKTMPWTLLIPGVPGVSYAMGTAGVYEVHLLEVK